MVSQALVDFLRREFGVRCLKILNDTHMKLGIDDVEYADEEGKKLFILELQQFFREKSLARSEMLVSELMSLLGISADYQSYVDTSLTQANLDKIKDYVRREGNMRIKTCYAQTDALINLYMKNTEKAHQKGITSDQIKKMTARGLRGLKSNLFEVTNKVENDYNLKTSVQIMENKVKEAMEIGEAIDTTIYEKQLAMKYAVEGYKKRVDQLFQDYHNTFVRSIDRKIQAEKEGKDTSHIKAYLEIVSQNTFDKIQKTYNSFNSQIQSN